MAKRSAEVSRGVRNPLSFVDKSKIADGLGFIVPIPTFFCAKTEKDTVNNNRQVNFIFIFIKSLNLLSKGAIFLFNYKKSMFIFFYFISQLGTNSIFEIEKREIKTTFKLFIVKSKTKSHFLAYIQMF